MAETVIQVENLSKKYVIDHQAGGSDSTLKDSIAEAAKSLGRLLAPGQKRDRPRREEFWALKDVSFEVKRGDRLGIIGRNGAGKSTLLKILSRITEPTTGQVTLHGRVASLLEVGTGFHPDLTGRENIFLNGSILGMSRIEISRKFDEIVAFAEIEQFLDTPVKRYSSGMYVRLAFAVAAHLEPEILIVDEVLAVGDVQFQKKCLGKMQEVSENEGRTVLFVSHNIETIQRLCSCGIMLEKGQISFRGSVADVLPKYLSTNLQIASPNIWIDVSHACRSGTQEAYFTEVLYSSLNDAVLLHPYSQGALKFLLKIQSNSFTSVGSLAIFIANLGTVLVNADTVSLGQSIQLKAGTNLLELSIQNLYLNPGRYVVGLWMDKTGSGDEVFDYIESAFEIEVADLTPKMFGIDTLGIVPCEFSCKVLEHQHA